MDKMTIYNAVRAVPEEAQKRITGGRLNGMTDISPMWRIKKLTELFGPAGIGWKFDPPVFEEKSGVNGEVMVHCFTCLYIRQDDGSAWSAPIPGVGGSMLISTEKSGQRTDDEAYKKAYTDAQSVACKALGVGADVYWKSDTTKYTAPPQPQPLLCACCGKKVSGIAAKDGKRLTADEVAERSRAKYGRILCWECVKKHTKEDGGMAHA